MMAEGETRGIDRTSIGFGKRDEFTEVLAVAGIFGDNGLHG